MFIYESDRYQGAQDARQTDRKRADWRGVKVIVTEQCCREAQELAGRPFLTAEAPIVPLPFCTQPTCRCRYRHFDDRRTAARRLEERGMLPRRVTNERRGRGCRRAGDERS